MTVLVIGANGYLGSHVTRQLVDAGEDVQIMLQPNASTIGIDDLKTTRFLGDIWDNDVLREAMTGAATSTTASSTPRAGSPGLPLYRTNVGGTRNVLDVADRGAPRASVPQVRLHLSYATVNRRRGRRHRADEITSKPVSPTMCAPGFRPKRWCLPPPAPGSCPPSRCACRRPMAPATGATPRTGRSSPGPRSGSCRLFP